VRFVALDFQHARIERELKEAHPSLPMHPQLGPDESECVADAAHAATRVPTARSGANRC
jgi:hypothetical protein